MNVYKIISYKALFIGLMSYCAHNPVVEFLHDHTLQQQLQYDAKSSSWFLEVTPLLKHAVFGPQLAPNLTRIIKFLHPYSLVFPIKTIAIIIVPGSFSAHSPNYFADGRPCYEAVKNFARTLAAQEKCSVEVISFTWSGKNSHEARAAAAEKLAELISTFYANTTRYQSIYTIAQSHGGNIVNIASNLIPNRRINTMVHLATPVREGSDPLYCPTNFDELYSFYSHEDIIQLIGAIDTRALKTSLFSPASWRIFSPKPDRTVKNIKVHINSKEPGHRALKKILANLSLILQKARSYTIHHDLILNMASRNMPAHDGDQEPIMLAIRKQSAAEIAQSQQEQFRRECALSDYEKSRYFNLYKRSIDKKFHLFSFF